MDTNTNIEKRTSVNELNNDIKSLFQKITEIAIDRKYIIKVNGKEETHLEFIIPQTGNLSQNGRKKLASRIRVANKKTGQKSLNAFLWYLKLKNITDYKITVDLSNKEKEIRRLRKEYVRLRNETEVARLKYLEVKGDFYR
jgi:hypothetical protein